MKLKIFVFLFLTIGVTAYFSIEERVGKKSESKPEEEIVTSGNRNPFLQDQQPSAQPSSRPRQERREVNTKPRRFEDVMLERSANNDSDRERRLAAKNKYFDKLREQLKEIKQNPPPAVAIEPSTNTATTIEQAPDPEPNEELYLPEDDLGYIPEEEFLEELPPEEYYEPY